MATNLDASDPTRGSEMSVNLSPSKAGRWILRGTICVAVLAIVASAYAFWPKSNSLDLSSALTHKIKRDSLLVTVTEQGMLESSDNTEIKCQVRGQNTVIWVVEGGTYVEPGDVLVRLDTLVLEDAIAERSKYAHWSRSAAERSRADVRRSELAIEAYEQGTYQAQLMGLEKDLAISESQLRTTRNMLNHAEFMFESGYVSELEVEERRFAVTQAELDVEVRQTQIDVLRDYDREMQLETLQGNHKAAVAKLAADEERATMDATRRDLAVEELEYCTIFAERSGLVIYPSAAEWKQAPDIEEGATVHRDQVLLLMPNLDKMQVKVGIHESVIDRVEVGMKAKVTLPDQVLEGTVTSVATVTRPAGWWTGNVVKYDTIIELPNVTNLKPGMSAEVEILLAEYEDVLTIPVAAVVETEQGPFCWVKTSAGAERRPLRLGDDNDNFIVVEGGIDVDDEVILNPIGQVPEAKAMAIQPGESSDEEEDSEESNSAEQESENSGDAAEGIDVDMDVDVKEKAGKE